MRTTVDLDEDAYQIARTVSHERKISMGRVISEFITLRHALVAGAANEAAASEDELFPTFRCARRVTSEDVKALDDEN